MSVLFILLSIIFIGVLLLEIVLQVLFYGKYFDDGIVIKKKELYIDNAEIDALKLNRHYSNIDFGPKYIFINKADNVIYFRNKFLVILYMRFFPLFRGKIEISDKITIYKFVNVSTFLLILGIIIFLFIDIKIFIISLIYFGFYLFVEYRLFNKLSRDIEKITHKKTAVDNRD